MKILVVTDAWKPQLNGVVRTYENLGRELTSMGHEMQVIGPADFPLRMQTPGYKEIELVIAPYRRLRRMIEDYDPDSIHIATEGPLGKAARKYCLKTDTAYTSWYHTQFPEYVARRVAKILPPLENWSREITRKSIINFHAPSKAMIVTTQTLEDELKESGHTAPMHRATYGIHIDLFNPGEATLFKDLPRPIALYVGRIAMEKNLEDFLSMDWEGAKVVVGHGPALPDLQKKYPEAVFTGKKTGEELVAHYRSSDVFVFPSRTDTFGMVLVEAMACGLPVAAYDVIGPKDIITAPHLGVLHESLSHAALTALAHDSTEAQRHNHAKENYSWESATEQFLKALKLGLSTSGTQ